MEKRVLGKTGLDVGILGLGGANHERAGQEELKRIIDRAEEVGANCLDLYWNCEELVSKALKGRRSKFVLMSKIEITEVFGLTEWLSKERVGKLFVDMDQCGDCGACEERCPGDLPIRKRLQSCAEYLTRPRQ